MVLGQSSRCKTDINHSYIVAFSGFVISSPSASLGRDCDFAAVQERRTLYFLGTLCRFKYNFLKSDDKRLLFHLCKSSSGSVILLCKGLLTFIVL